MIAVIFEVWPKPERKKEYLDIATQLRPILEKIDGFISIERFEKSIARRGVGGINGRSRARASTAGGKILHGNTVEIGTP